MTQISDIELDGAGYMLAPGGYQRASAGEPDGRAGRWLQREFGGGQRRAFAREEDQSWDSEGVGPAFAGQGVEPWPNYESYTDSGLAGRTVSATTRIASAVAGSHAYYGNGRYWYESPALTAGSWTGFTQKYDAGSGKAITDAAAYQDNIAICLGTTLDIQIYDVSAGTTSTLLAGEKGGVCAGYAGRLLYSNPAAGSQHQLRLTTGGGIDTRLLDSPIVRMALHGGKVVIATRSSLYLLGGKSDPAAGKWIGEPEPIFTHGIWTGDSDYAFLTSFGGKLYTWLAGQVMEWDPNGGASKQGWRATGLEGRDCFGGVVAGDKLLVCITNRQGVSETWAFDGAGWWMIDTRTSGSSCWPIYVAGAGTRDAVVFRSGSSSITYDLVRLVYRDAVNHNYRSDAAFKTSLLDAGERESQKAWRAIGASFATPEDRGNASSVDSLTVAIAYSIDGGQSFTTHLTASPFDPADRVFDLEGKILGGSPESRTLQIRVSWSSVSDWAPVLTGIWVDYEVLGGPARRRRWQIAVRARDRLVRRDGSVEPRSGREIAADLWSLWEAGVTMALHDVDFDASGQVFGVRIASIGEEISKPGDADRWGESTLNLTLVEL
jgi:hypothetical protein